LVDCSLGSQ